MAHVASDSRATGLRQNDRTKQQKKQSKTRMSIQKTHWEGTMATGSPDDEDDDVSPEPATDGALADSFRSIWRFSAVWVENKLPHSIQGHLRFL